MNRFALTFTVKPDSIDAVADILTNYPRPQVEIDEGTRLLATAVLMRSNRVVRIIQIDGDVSKVMRHIAADPSIRETEEALNPHLTTPRDLTDADEAKAFFQRAMMRRILHMETPSSELPDRVRPYFVALQYPIAPGRADEAEEMLGVPEGGWPEKSEDFEPPNPRIDAETAFVNTSVFRKDDLFVRVNEWTGDMATAKRHLAHTSIELPYIRKQNKLFDAGYDISTAEGFMHFLNDREFTKLTERRSGVEETS